MSEQEWMLKKPEAVEIKKEKDARLNVWKEKCFMIICWGGRRMHKHQKMGIVMGVNETDKRPFLCSTGKGFRKKFCSLEHWHNK